MKYAIVYSSYTGNTAMLASRLRDCLPEDERVYFGPPDEAALDAALLFVGFWTDKGSCAPDLAVFLQQLEGKQVFLFGTAGFGGSEAYFSQVEQRVAANLSGSNTLLGWYMCQGKMGAEVRARYETIAQTDPEKAKPFLENFDRALSHPDAADLDALERAARAALQAQA